MIELFVKEIDDTEVLIKDSEFLLRYPIVTKGIAKVKLENCIAHLEGSHAGFLNLNHAIGGADVIVGSVIKNNSVDISPYNKYGSRHSKEYWPKNTEYYLKVNKTDEVINVKTDKRGYPGSCGTENKNKDVTIIIKNTGEINMNKENDMISITELNQMIETAKKQGMREINLTKKIFISSDEILNDEEIVRNVETCDYSHH